MTSLIFSNYQSTAAIPPNASTSSFDFVITAQTAIVPLGKTLQLNSLRLLNNANLIVYGSIFFTTGITVEGGTVIVYNTGQLATPSSSFAVPASPGRQPSVGFPTITIGVSGASTQSAKLIIHPGAIITGTISSTSGEIAPPCQVLNFGIVEFLDNSGKDDTAMNSDGTPKVALIRNVRVTSNGSTAQVIIRGDIDLDFAIFDAINHATIIIAAPTMSSPPYQRHITISSVSSSSTEKSRPIYFAIRQNGSLRIKLNAVTVLDIFADIYVDASSTVDAVGTVNAIYYDKSDLSTLNNILLSVNPTATSFITGNIATIYGLFDLTDNSSLSIASVQLTLSGTQLSTDSTTTITLQDNSNLFIAGGVNTILGQLTTTPASLITVSSPLSLATTSTSATVVNNLLLNSTLNIGASTITTPHDVNVRIAGDFVFLSGTIVARGSTASSAKPVRPINFEKTARFIVTSAIPTAHALSQTRAMNIVPSNHILRSINLVSTASECVLYLESKLSLQDQSQISFQTMSILPNGYIDNVDNNSVASASTSTSNLNIATPVQFDIILDTLSFSIIPLYTTPITLAEFVESPSTYIPSTNANIITSNMAFYDKMHLDNTDFVAFINANIQTAKIKLADTTTTISTTTTTIVDKKNTTIINTKHNKLSIFIYSTVQVTSSIVESATDANTLTNANAADDNNYYYNLCVDNHDKAGAVLDISLLSRPLTNKFIALTFFNTNYKFIATKVKLINSLFLLDNSAVDIDGNYIPLEVSSDIMSITSVSTMAISSSSTAYPLTVYNMIVLGSDYAPAYIISTSSESTNGPAIVVGSLYQYNGNITSIKQLDVHFGHNILQTTPKAMNTITSKLVPSQSLAQANTKFLGITNIQYNANTLSYYDVSQNIVFNSDTRLLVNPSATVNISPGVKIDALPSSSSSSSSDTGLPLIQLNQGRLHINNSTSGDASIPRTMTFSRVTLNNLAGMIDVAGGMNVAAQNGLFSVDIKLHKSFILLDTGSTLTLNDDFNNLASLSSAIPSTSAALTGKGTVYTIDRIVADNGSVIFNDVNYQLGSVDIGFVDISPASTVSFTQGCYSHNPFDLSSFIPTTLSQKEQIAVPVIQPATTAPITEPPTSVPVTPPVAECVDIYYKKSTKTWFILFIIFLVLFIIASAVAIAMIIKNRKMAKEYEEKLGKAQYQARRASTSTSQASFVAAAAASALAPSEKNDKTTSQAGNKNVKKPPQKPMTSP